ncbi:MAG: hypothetical protein HQL03_01845 [Nitrospirae bacterium]|nr:hypothetical protein [Nitrospirota bacterium]MBF0591318.1 hypothetical protein [Nitrospirota bacterium]
MLHGRLERTADVTDASYTKPLSQAKIKVSGHDVSVIRNDRCVIISNNVAFEPSNTPTIA